MSNKETFRAALVAAYTDLFANDPKYTYIAARSTPEQLADKMMPGLATVGASKDGDGVKRACKVCGIKRTYAAIRAYLNEVQS